jgi:hypothetical protein
MIFQPKARGNRAFLLCSLLGTWYSVLETLTITRRCVKIRAERALHPNAET